MTSSKQCLIDGCERPLYGKGMCNMHWQRARRTGDPATDRPPMVRRSACEVDGCGRKHKGSGLCNMHRMRMHVHGSLDLPPRKPLPAGPENHGWIGDQITYTPAHFRVVALHGSASLHLCVNCGGQAMDWAYDHGDPNELTCIKTGLAYSANPERYKPLCRRCHNRVDDAARRGDMECVSVVMMVTSDCPVIS
jgi:hypothetical protein